MVATATAHGGGGGGSGGGDEFLAVLRSLRTDGVVIYLSITIAEAPSHQLLYVMSRFVTISTATAYGTTHAAGLTGPSHTPDPPSTAEAIAKQTTEIAPAAPCVRDQGRGGRPPPDLKHLEGKEGEP